jgi:hypothetical protein
VYAGSYKDIIGTLSWSTDCGETYTKPKIIWPCVSRHAT